MLIATLPTLKRDFDLKRIDEILSNPLVVSARYNTGGDTPYTPSEILQKIAPLAQRHRKKLYIDLEGRQMRIARWTPQSRGCVTLNCDFEITLPASIHFRRVGWFNIISALPQERKIFFTPQKTREEYFLGESQSVHIVAKDFSVRGYLRKQDRKYIKAAVKYGINAFMLSFVEGFKDINEFYDFHDAPWARVFRKSSSPELVLKIESTKGMEWLKTLGNTNSTGLKLMAARDDLFLSFVDKRQEVIPALRLIIEKDPEAIVASRLLSGLEVSGEVTIADMADIILMHQLGYRHFMLSDELADNFAAAMRDWQKIIIPLLSRKIGQ